ncbi:hypothetical protein SFC79_01860 [Nocardioides sp. S-58]|uniref:Uncharacterized protein n=2 Tax=Nocardioides TaxID=1839 RepID=A0ABU5K6J0_9ACTN|nr:hypothetical protein [Nocardioides sp. S-58]MDZ5660496.1 hypothetical protein [Nocardioides sp. S-58]
MSSRRSIRRPLVALLVGVLVGGGLMAVTPAGAEVSNAVATNWNKIWNKELKPQADQRYYTKKKSNKRYYTKSDSDAKYQAAGSGYTKAESDTKYQPKGNYALTGSSYTKAESDAKYAPYPKVFRGVWAFSSSSNTEASFTEITYPELSAEPTAHFIPLGGVVPAGCGGTPAAPTASAGHLCVFQASDNNMGTVTLTRATFGTGPVGGTFGAVLWAFSSSATYGYTTGTFAVSPLALAVPGRTSPSTDADGTAGRP